MKGFGRPCRSGEWTVRAAAAGIAALILGIAFCSDIASAQQSKSGQTCEDDLKRISELQTRRAVWEKRLQDAKQELANAKELSANALAASNAAAREYIAASNEYLKKTNRLDFKNTAEGKALQAKQIETFDEANRANHRVEDATPKVGRLQHQVDGINKELNALLNKGCPTPQTSNLPPASAAPSTPAPQLPATPTAPESTPVAKVIPSPPGTAVQHVNQPDCASDYNSGRSLRWDKAKKTWIDADTGAEMGFQGMVAKDGMVIPAPPVVTARSGGKHQAQQDKADPERAHDSVTGQDLKWDRDKNTWVDTKTGNAVGFQGATISSLAPAGLPVCYAADATPPAGSGFGFGFGSGDTEGGDDRIQKDRRSGPKKP